ncbi:MAG: PD-(D/E)XK nuclease family protein [Candidatus Pacebacteria bacterium]|nr:PD-(D/E)XK nuclease family protein [Candidatus Paceibacterota bacterium]
MSVIDFKTGTREETENSTQLAIYYLLLSRLQSRVIRDAYYLYLDKSAKEEDLKEYSLDIVINHTEEFIKNILYIGEAILDCKNNNRWECPNKDVDNKACIHCRDYEKIISQPDDIEYIGQGPYNKSLYVINRI